MPRRALAAVLAAGAAAGLAATVCGPPRRTVYAGGPVLTMDTEDRVVEALGVEGERIGAVGSAAAVRAWAGAGAREVDLAGRALLPGFVDAHGHFPATGIYAIAADLNSPPIGGVRTLDDLVARLRERAAATRRGRFVVGLGYDDTLLAEGRHPTRADLDRVSTEHPVAAVHVSAHLAAVNTRALEALAIARETPDPEGGRIRRGPDGEPDGVLEETASEAVLRVATRPGLRGSLAVLREGARRYLAAGVTTAQVGYGEAAMLGLQRFSRFGLLPLRVVFWPGPELADELLAGGRRLRSYDPDWFRFGAVKLIADGSIQGYTAWLVAPYHVPQGADPAARGYPRMPPAELAERVARYHAAGLQVAIHANGDAAIDAALAALEAAQRAHPRADARPVVIHAQMARPDQLDRMRALGAVPSFFALHVYYWGDRHRERFLGPERAARISPAASAAARGLRFTLHCDAPVVPIEPLRLVHAAVHRRTASGAELGPAERIPVRAALRAVTIDAAWQHFEEARKGSLEVGKLADLVVLARSPLDDPEHVGEIPVLETIVGGESAWRAAER
jgi:hypothetical protein